MEKEEILEIIEIHLQEMNDYHEKSTGQRISQIRTVVDLLAKVVLTQANVAKSVCSFYMTGMDTSGRCNNCGKNKWEH